MGNGEIRFQRLLLSIFPVVAYLGLLVVSTLVINYCDTRGRADGLDMRGCERYKYNGVEQCTVRLRCSCTGLTGIQGGEWENMSGETLNIME